MTFFFNLKQKGGQIMGFKENGFYFTSPHDSVRHMEFGDYGYYIRHSDDNWGHDVENHSYTDDDRRFHGIKVYANRKKSEKTANWFKRRSSNTGEEKDANCIGCKTSTDSPDDLNFALDFENVKIRYKSHGTEHIVNIKHLIIGQGNKGSWNNWWVGHPEGCRSDKDCWGDPVDSDVALKVPCDKGHIIIDTSVTKTGVSSSYKMKIRGWWET